MRLKVFFKTGIVSILLILNILVSGCGIDEAGRKQPLAKNGVLDLKDWDFEKNGVVKLDGEWEFYWEKLLQPQHFIENASALRVNYFTVPSTWNGFEIEGKKLNGDGFATFRLLIELNPERELYALKTLEMAHAYKMWINSKEALSNGIVGTSLETMKPQYLTNTTIVRHESGRVELLLQVSNFVHKKGGIWNPIQFGTMSKIKKLTVENLIIEFFLFGSILIMGFYHLGLFVLRKTEHSTLYFGAFCLLVALRIVLTGERTMFEYFPGLGWETLLRMEYLTVYLSPPIFLLFLGSFFSQNSRIISRIVTPIALVFSMIVMVTKPSVFSHTLPYYHVFILICCVYATISMVQALVQKKEHSYLVFIGAMILLTTLVYDILIANGLIYGNNLSPFGLFAFIFIQSVTLSIRFSKAFTLAEELSTKLEEKVAQRTEGLRNANREVRLAIKKQQETQSQLIQSQKMESIGTLAGGIAHDFNNILGTMMGYTELLINDQAPDSQEKKYLETIYSSGERAAELVSQILTFSRTSSLEQVPLKIEVPIKEILKMMRATLSESIEIKEAVAPDCGFILANQTQISQIIVNLCTNAGHAMKDKGGLLEIKLEPVSIRKGDHFENPAAEGSYLQLSIRDNGKGIPNDIKDRIFDPFFTTKAFEGSGLGLSIVHGIVKNHQGFIEVESEVQKGTEFRVFFPVVEEQKASDLKSISELKKSKAHILIVESDRQSSVFYGMTLEKLGFKITAVYDSLEALERFRAEPEAFNLILADQTMFEMTGFEMSREILKIDPTIPIILAVNDGSDLTDDEAKNLGIRCFLTKPVRMTELAQNISELI